VTEDVELQAYVNEVSLNGSGPNGGIGRVNMTINHKTHLGCRLRGLILVYTFVHRTQDVQNLWWLQNTTPHFLLNCDRKRNKLQLSSQHMCSLS